MVRPAADGDDGAVDRTAVVGGLAGRLVGAAVDVAVVEDVVAEEVGTEGLATEDVAVAADSGGREVATDGPPDEQAPSAPVTMASATITPPARRAPAWRRWAAKDTTNDCAQRRCGCGPTRREQPAANDGPSSASPTRLPTEIVRGGTA
jgi:hypothetical protein